MRTSFTARHYRAPESLKTFAEDEVKRLTKLNDGILECDIILDYEKQTQVAEIMVKIQGQRFTAMEKSDQVRKSITLAVDKLERQLRKHKTRRQRRVKDKTATIDSELVSDALKEI